MIKPLFSKNNLFIRRVAVTVAEMMISIFTVGIVAELTVPEFVEQYDENMTIMLLRKNYAALNEAFGRAVNEHGTPDTWGLGEPGDTGGLANLNKILTENMRVGKNCGKDSGCFTNILYKDLKGTQNPNVLDTDPTFTKVALQNGTLISATQWDENCSLDCGDTQSLENVCGFIGIDINGAKRPNQFGVDYFGFALTKYGIVPLGSLAQQGTYPFNGFCNRKSNANKTYENGLSCSAWVLYNGNMDYIDCNNLNWHGRLSCDAK